MKKALNKITNKIVGIHSGISGNVDECELTSDNRKQGVKINDLILH
jgi:hypothetical protein